MNLLLVSLALVSTTLVVSASPQGPSLPEQFYGKFRLHHFENFDEYLEAKGYSWYTRKLVGTSVFEKVFLKNMDNSFDYVNFTTKKNVAYWEIRLGRAFHGEGLDSRPHNITFFMQNGKLYEKHIPLDENGEAKNEVYEYCFEGGFLIVRMEANGVVAKRFYKRVNE